MAVDRTIPLSQVDTLDLLREYDLRLSEPQTLGVRVRLVELKEEIRHRALRVPA